MNSFPKVMCVIDTSSRAMLNSLARLRRSARMRWETASRWVMSSAASNWATMAFRTSLPMEGRTRSS